MSTPVTYLGFPVPDRIRRDREENGPYAVLFHAWCEGVDAVLVTAVPLLRALADTGACEFDYLGACLTHGYPPPLCADGEARKLITGAGAEG